MKAAVLRETGRGLAIEDVAISLPGIECAVGGARCRWPKPSSVSSGGSALWRSRTCLQPDAATLSVTDGSFADDFDSRCVQSIDQLDQRIDIAADHRVRGFHPLNGGHGKPRKTCELALIDAEKHPCGAHLS